MSEDRKLRNGLHQPGARPAREEIGRRRKPDEDQSEAQDYCEDEGDDLVAREGRGEAADREVGPGEERRSDVAARDHPVVGIPEPVDGRDDREGKGQRHDEEQPRGEKLADDRLPRSHRHRQQKLDRPEPPLLGPQAHPRGGHQKQEQPRQPVEERRERGLAPLEEAAESEGKEPGKQEKDHQEHVGDRRLEVRRQLALRDRTDHRPARPHAASATVSERVIDRKKSSSFPVAARALSSCGVPLATMRPRSMMIARVQAASTSSRMCVEKMIALFSPISRISVRTSCFWFGSSPSVGSSRMSTSGSWISACARQVRWRKPFESVSIAWPRTFSRWHSSTTRRIALRFPSSKETPSTARFGPKDLLRFSTLITAPLQNTYTDRHGLAEVPCGGRRNRILTQPRSGYKQMTNDHQPALSSSGTKAV